MWTKYGFYKCYNPRSSISRKNEYKETIVSEGVSFGANCTIICGIYIAEYSFIGGGSLLNRSTKAFSLMVGVPAKQIGWMSKNGDRMNLPLEGNGVWECPKTKEVYYLKNDQIYTE